MILILALSIFGADMSQPVEADVQKQIIYRKEQTEDFTGSTVRGEGQLPPAFFIMKAATPKAESLLTQRLKFSMKNLNATGF